MAIEKYDQPAQTLVTETMRRLLSGEAMRRGLSTSALLRMITAEWLTENVPAFTHSDPPLRPAEPTALGRFLAEACHVDGRATVRVAELFTAWQAWARLHQVDPGHVNTFTDALRDEVQGLTIYRPRTEDRTTLPRHYRGVGMGTR